MSFELMEVAVRPVVTAIALVVRRHVRIEVDAPPNPLPLSGVGKVQKHELRSEWLSRQAQSRPSMQSVREAAK
jgi:hypothetical protein